jgi:predicted alpha/beta hydrolase
VSAAGGAQARGTEVSFAGLGGQQTLRLWRAAEASAPVVVIAPALGLRASWYDELACAIASRGVHAAITEWPGQGSSPVRPSRRSDWGYRELLDHMAASRTAACDALVGAGRFAWLGHSLGGTIALMDAGRSSEVDRVVLIASGTPYQGAWSGRMRLQLRIASHLFPVAARVLGYHDGRLGFGGREARTLMTQWSELARHGTWRVEGVDIEGCLRACACPILSVRLEGDDWAPAAATDHLLSKISSSSIERVSWSGPTRSPHVRWPRTPEHAADLTVRFLRA